MQIVIIAAIAENGVIGKAGKLPWHIPEDLKRFKQLTIGHSVIMGRKTFESIGKPLVDRKNIVITNQKNYMPIQSAGAASSSDIIVVHSLKEAIKKCSGGKAFIIGGQSVFEEALPIADRLEITEVHSSVDGDVFFPEIGGEWKETAREDHDGFSFVTYLRVQ